MEIQAREDLCPSAQGEPGGGRSQRSRAVWCVQQIGCTPLQDSDWHSTLRLREAEGPDVWASDDITN